MSETCERCQGNGEIVLDWETYLHPRDLADEERSVAECPDCDGAGTKEVPNGTCNTPTGDVGK